MEAAELGEGVMSATRKKILLWILALSFLCTIPILAPLESPLTSPAAQGQVTKEERLVQEVATVMPLSDYWPLALKYIPEGAYDIKVSGTVKELKGRSFDFFAFTKLNYERWKANASYQTILEAKHVSAYSLSFSPTGQEVTDGLRLVVSNIYAQEHKEESLISTTIKLSRYSGETFWPSFPALMIGYKSELNVRGTAREIHGYRFDIYVLDNRNYDLWSTGRSYSAYYEAKGTTSYDFSFVVPREKSGESLYFVVKRAEPNVELDVDLAATGSWLAPTAISVEYDTKISWKEKAPGCLIATAAYGSELALEVQFLRTFRDQFVKSTFAGSAFMKAFDTFYYSFSPAAASVTAQNPVLSKAVRVLLYPLIAALRTGSTIFRSLSFEPELAVVISGTVASALVGATYLVSLAAVASICTGRSRRRWTGTLSKELLH